MGIETEYGISCLEDPQVPSEELSRILTGSYANACRALGMLDDVAWDLGGTSLIDQQAPEQLAVLTAQERGWQRGTSKVLRNGARLYVDHAHPEYAAPEALGPRQALRYDLAGDAVMRRAMADAIWNGEVSPVAYRNNVDGKGSAYGTHENYLVQRSVPFDDLLTALVPFLVTRPILVGSGRVGLGPTSEEPGFQISQRADYVERIVGPHTTYQRPIVNTRDEPHAEPGQWRRFHVIGGDANCMQASTYLKLGTLSLVLWVLETRGLSPIWEGLELADPVAEVRAVSRDLDLTHMLTLKDGRRLDAIAIQRAYLALAYHHVGPEPDPETEHVLDLWADALDSLERGGWRAATRQVEWAAKLALLEARRERDGLGWDAPELRAMDLQWADVRAERSLAARVGAATGWEEFVTAEEVDDAEFSPPAETRAWLRGELISRYPDQVYSASWHSIVLEPSSGGMFRLPMTQPLAGTARQAAPLFAYSPRLEEFLSQLVPDSYQEGTP